MMIFKEQRRLSNVKNFLLRNTKIIHADKNNGVFIDNFSINRTAYFYDLYQNQLIHDFKRNITFLDLVSNHQKNIENKSIIKFDGKQYLLLTSKSNLEYCELSVYNLLIDGEKILEEKYYWGIGDIFNNSFYFEKYKTTLSSLSLITSEYEWEVDLGVYGEIRKIIGALGNNLWVSLIKDPTEKLYSLLYLDIQTGKVIQYFTHDYHFSDFGVLLSETHQSIISLKGGVGSQRTWLYEYDATTGTPIRALQVPSLAEKMLGVKSFTVYKDHIYFTATDDTQFVANTVGVLDYKTLELLWYEKVPNGNLLLDPPQVTDTHLYVLDAEGTLHIFEREELV